MTVLVSLFMLFILALPCVVSAQTTHQPVPSVNDPAFDPILQNFLKVEDANRTAETFGNTDWIVSGCLAADSGNRILAAFACTAYAKNGFYASQVATAIDLAASPGPACTTDDLAWVIIADGVSAPGGNFVQSGSSQYYVNCVSASQPTTPSNATMLFLARIVGGVTTVVDLRRLGPWLEPVSRTHDTTDVGTEQRAWWGDAFSRYVVSGGLHATSGTTSAVIASTRAYVLDTTSPRQVRYIQDLTSRTITYSGGNGTYWLIAHANRTDTVSGWTRVEGTHYLWQLSATQPVVPNQAVLLMQVTVASGAITTVVDYRDRIINDLSTETLSMTTAPSTRWIVTASGRIQPSAGVQVAHYGTIEAGAYRIFDLSLGGTITFPQGQQVWAEWWGAAPGIDSAAAIQSAWAAGPQGMHVRLGRGTFLVGSTITSPVGTNLDFSLVGDSTHLTILQRTSGFTGTLISIGTIPTQATEFNIANLELNCLDNTVGTVGLRLNRTAFYQVDHIRVRFCEKGIWVSGGSYQTFQGLWLDNNTTNMLLDNAGDLGLTSVSIRDSNFRHADAVGLDIDGTPSTSALVRSVSCFNCTFEHDQVVLTTDIGVRIRKAQQIHFYNSWWESASQHVSVTGDGPSNQPTAFLTWTNCQFGILRGAATQAFSFTGTSGNDGMGSTITSTSFSQGLLTLSPNIRVKLADLALLGTATIDGSGWYNESSSAAESHNYEQLPTTTHWRVQRLNKAETTHTSRAYDIFATDTTTDATIMTVASYSTPTDSSVRVVASVLAKSGNGADQAAYTLMALIRNNAGTASIIGATQSLHTAQESNAAWDCVITVSGPNFNVRGTGAAGTTVRWVVRMALIQVLDN